VGVLLRWWLDTYVADSTSERQERDRFRLYFETTDLVTLRVAALSAGRVENFLQHWAREGLAPASVNKLRAMSAPLGTARAGPASCTARTRHATWRCARCPGARPRSSRRTRCRSYDNESTKGRREEAVPIAPPLVPHIEAAIDAAPGELLFPKWDGKMRTDGDALGERLRRALGRAGIVTGYLHSCRRCKRGQKPQPAEEHPDNARRRCPRCGMVLWAKPLPKRLRVHDLRHTTATLLLAAGVDLYAVARILRHTDPRVMFETYAHLVPGYLHEQIGRLGKLLPSPESAAPAEREQVRRESDDSAVASGSVGSVGLSKEVGKGASLPTREAVPASGFATPLLPAEQHEAWSARST
jgi:integrase